MNTSLYNLDGLSTDARLRRTLWAKRVVLSRSRWARSHRGGWVTSLLRPLVDRSLLTSADVTRPPAFDVRVARRTLLLVTQKRLWVATTQQVAVGRALRLPKPLEPPHDGRVVHVQPPRDLAHGDTLPVERDDLPVLVRYSQAHPLHVFHSHMSAIAHTWRARLLRPLLRGEWRGRRRAVRRRAPDAHTNRAEDRGRQLLPYQGSRVRPEPWRRRRPQERTRSRSNRRAAGDRRRRRRLRDHHHQRGCCVLLPMVHRRMRQRRALVVRLLGVAHRARHVPLARHTGCLCKQKRHLLSQGYSGPSDFPKLRSALAMR